MWILIVALLALTALAMIIGKGYYYRINKKIEKGELEEIPPVVEVDEETYYNIYAGILDPMEDPQIIAAIDALQQ